MTISLWYTSYEVKSLFHEDTLSGRIWTQHHLNILVLWTKYAYKHPKKKALSISVYVTLTTILAFFVIVISCDVHVRIFCTWELIWRALSWSSELDTVALSELLLSAWQKLCTCSKVSRTTFANRQDGFIFHLKKNQTSRFRKIYYLLCSSNGSGSIMLHIRPRTLFYNVLEGNTSLLTFYLNN